MKMGRVSFAREDADGKKLQKTNGDQITSARGKERYCACATVYKKGLAFEESSLHTPH